MPVIASVAMEPNTNTADKLVPINSECNNSFCVAPSLVRIKKIPINEHIIPMPATTIGIIILIIPISVEIKKLLNEKDYLDKILKDGCNKANDIATKKIKKIHEIVGF